MKARRFEEKEKEREERRKERGGRRHTFANLHNMFNPSVQLYIRS